MSSTAIYRVPTACGCRVCRIRGEALGQSGEGYGHRGGQCPEGLGGGWKKSPVFINRTLSKALKGLFGYPGRGFSQAEGGQVGLQELVTSTLWVVPALRLDLQAWRRTGRMPTGTAASEKAKVKDQFPKRRAPWARRCCAGRPGGQPACLVVRSSRQFPWGEPSVEAALQVSPPTVRTAREHGARGNTDSVTQRSIGINTWPGAPGLRSATTLVAVIAGRERWTPEGGGKTHIRWAHARYGLCGRRDGGSSSPS